MTKPQNQTPSGDLRKISVDTQHSDHVYQCTVIAVPDIGSMSTVRSWSDGSSCWLETLIPNLLPEPCLLEYHHGLQDDDSFSWEQLVQKGDHFFELLSSKTNPYELQSRPLYFISHGLGGVITKRGLGYIYEHFHEQVCQKIISMLAGVIFLGSPHPTFGEDRQWTRFSHLQQAHKNFSKQHRITLLEGMGVIANVSQKFDESGIAVPILSAYEGRTTKLGKGWLANKRAIVIDEQLAKTKAKNEKLLKVDAHHGSICHMLPNTAFSTELAEFLSSTQARMRSSPIDHQLQDGHSIAGWTVSTSENFDNDEEEMRKTSLFSTPPQTNVVTTGSSNLSNFQTVPFNHSISDELATIRLPCYLLTPPVPEFHGRESVLQAIDDVLSPSSANSNSDSPSSLKTFAICGPGGIGKTQVAMKYAYSARTYFDLIFFLRADSIGKLAQGFADISVLLNLESSFTKGDQVVSRDMVLEWLSKPVRRQNTGAKSTEEKQEVETTWLIVFDNADDLSILHSYWPVAGNGSVLLTSRDPLAKTLTHVYCTNGLDLQPFTGEESGSFLRNLTGYNKPKDRVPSEKVASKLSGFPLALSQIARTISRRNLSFKEFLEFYEEDASRLNILQNDVGVGSKTLYTVWAFEDLSPIALSLIQIISLLDLDRIPESMLMKVQDPGQVSILQLEHYPSSFATFVEARTELTRCSLVKRNIDLKELETHRVIQDTARARMSSDQFIMAFAQALSLVYSSWHFSEFEHSTERWLSCEPLVPHINSLLKLSGRGGVLESERVSKRQFSRLLMDAGWYHIERGNIEQTKPFLHASEAICQGDLENCMTTLADVHFCRAEIACITNDTVQAIFHTEKNLSILANLDPDDWRIPQGHNEAAEAYAAAGVWDMALKEADLAIIGYSQLPVPEYADWAVTNKGLSLCNLGRYDDASKVIEEYLCYREETFGPMDTESFKTGFGLLVLGRIRGFQGRTRESLNFHLKALAQYHSTIGPNHYRSVALKIILGDSYASLFDNENAEAMYKSALQGYGNKSEHFPQVARTALKLSQLLISMNLQKEAQYYRKIAHESLGRLSQKLRREVTEEDLPALIPNWAK